MSESTYIVRRKIKATCLGLRFLLCRVFSVKKKRVVFSTFEGDGGFCCNPRYIAEELHRRHPEMEFIWLTHDPTREFPPYIRAVKDTSWRTAYYLSTAHIWIDNYRKPYGTRKRKSQIYIQTWHASLGFKAVGLYRGAAFPKIARLVSAWDSSLIDRILSNSDYCDRIYPKKLLYDGPTLRVGSPRVDPLINDRAELKKRLHQQLKMPENTKIFALCANISRRREQRKKASHRRTAEPGLPTCLACAGDENRASMAYPAAFASTIICEDGKNAGRAE